MEPVEDEGGGQDDPVESGALDDEDQDGGETTERPPAHEDPVESGGLEP